MNLKQLSDDELLKSLKELKRNEAKATLSLLYHLIELEDRGLFRDAGYSSLFDYCTRCLGYSEGAAGRRVAGARCLREHPELAKLLVDGKINLSNIAIAAKSIKSNETTIEEIVGKSHRAVQMLITPASKSKPKERIKPIVLAKKVSASSMAPEGRPKKAEREERYEIKFSVTKEVYEEFEEIRAELSNKLGADLSIEAVFKKLLSLHKNKVMREASKPVRTDTRRISTFVKRQVIKRDHGQCTYVGRDGTRCTEKRYLDFDHIVPFAKGGRSEVGNIRLLCKAHNRLCAEEVFGRDKVNYYTSVHGRNVPKH